MFKLAQVSSKFPKEIIEWKKYWELEGILFNPNTPPDKRITIENDMSGLNNILPPGPYNMTAAFNGYWIRPSQIVDFNDFDVVLIDVRDNNLWLLNKLSLFRVYLPIHQYVDSISYHLILSFE